MTKECLTGTRMSKTKVTHSRLTIGKTNVRVSYELEKNEL